MHPYECARTLKSRAKHESIRLNYGSLYKVVEGLERGGLIRERETVRDGRRPERTIYEITDAGSREFTEWLSDLLATPVKEYPQFEAALSLLPGVSPDEALVLLGERCQALEHQLATLNASLSGSAAAGIDRLFTIEADYQRALVDAELDWVRGLVKDIESGALEGLNTWRGWHQTEQGEQ
jgi:DNA-binding PadR family transcriptional regulator